MSKDKTNYAPHGGKHRIAKDNTGYEILGDKIWPCPGTAEVVEALQVRKEGLDAYIEAMNRYIVEQFRIITEEQKCWWIRAEAAYGLDPSVSYRWNSRGKFIEKIPEPKAETESGEQKGER